MNEEEESNQIDIGNLPDFGTGINVITITYNNNDDSLPHMDLGDCSPWVAITLLKSAMETLEIMAISPYIDSDSLSGVSI
jgi:hypothetical protein